MEKLSKLHLSENWSNLGSKECCVFNLLPVLFPDMGCAPCRASRDASHIWHATSQLPLDLGLEYALRELELRPPE